MEPWSHRSLFPFHSKYLSASTLFSVDGCLLKDPTQWFWVHRVVCDFVSLLCFACFRMKRRRLWRPTCGLRLCVFTHFLFAWLIDICISALLLRSCKTVTLVRSVPTVGFWFMLSISACFVCYIYLRGDKLSLSLSLSLFLSLSNVTYTAMDWLSPLMGPD